MLTNSTVHEYNISLVQYCDLIIFSIAEDNIHLFVIFNSYFKKQKTTMQICKYYNKHILKKKTSEKNY